MLSVWLLLFLGFSINTIGANVVVQPSTPLFASLHCMPVTSDDDYETSMLVTYYTLLQPHEVGESYVSYDEMRRLRVESGAPTLSLLANLSHTTSYTLAPSYSSGSIHYVILRQLKPGVNYEYRLHVRGVHDQRAHHSATYFFTQPPIDSSSRRHFRVLATADMGSGIGGQSVAMAMIENEQQAADLALVAGDVAYANNDQRASPHNRWDYYQSLIAPLTAFFPWHYSRGNHDGDRGERFHPFSHRLGLHINQHHPLAYYSFNYDTMHIIILDTEENVYDVNGRINEEQMKFLRNDLRAANDNEQRRRRPWLVVVAHRPLWDSHRKFGPSLALRNQLVPLFDEFKVNLYLCGHEHVYERTYPLIGIDGKLIDVNNRHHKGGGTVYAIIAAERRGLKRKMGVGDDSDDDGDEDDAVGDWTMPQPMWSAVRNDSTYGYARLDVYGSDYILLQYLSVEVGGKRSFVLDECRLEPF